MRCSAADAFLHPAASRPNLEVRSGVFVERIVFEGDRAVGVELVVNGERETVRAVREVIVSGGTYHSPVLLMLSGIGPAARPRVLRDRGAPGPPGRPQPPGPLHGQRQLPDRRARPLRDLHAGELRAPRERGPRPADLELPRGGRLLQDAPGSPRPGRRVPLRCRSLLRPGPDTAAGQRLRLRAGDHQADVTRQGRSADADAGLQADGALQLPDDRGGPGEHARGRPHRARDRVPGRGRRRSCASR